MYNPNKFLVIDTETTGIDYDECSIIQLAAEYHENGKVVSTFNEYILPDKDQTINLGALKANGTKLSYLKGGDINIRFTEAEVVTHFTDWLLKLNLSRSVNIVGMNVGFDIVFLDRLFKKHNIKGIWSGDVLPYRKYDVMAVYHFLTRTKTIDLDKLGIQGSSLNKIALALKIDTSKYKLHDALEDVKLTAEVLYELEARQKYLVELSKSLKSNFTNSTLMR